MFVTALEVAEIGRVLFQGLSQAGHVAMTEDAPHAGEERVFDAVAGDVLPGEVCYKRLRHGESLGCHILLFHC